MARLFQSLTVRENIAVALERHLTSRSAASAAIWSPRARASERRASRRVEHIMGVLGLEDYGDKFVGELSTGTRRMVDIACVMTAEPRILLLDEPSSGLAQGEIEVLGPVIQRLARESGSGVLVIEHDLPLVAAMSDRLIAMELGRVIASGDPQDVTADPAVIGSYLSASSAVINRSGDVYAAARAALGKGTNS
jgi:branched-chain amino acid transport system ATP-binding protein